MAKTRNSLPGTYVKNVKLFPNGSKTSEKKIKDLKTSGIQLHGDQIVEFATSIMDMYKAGHREVNVTCWLKKNYITFTGAPVDKSE